MQECLQRRSASDSRPQRAAILVVAILTGLALPVSAWSQGAERASTARDDESLALPLPPGSLEYTPGRGLRVGRLPLILGGYGNVNLIRDEGQPTRLEVDDLSVFVIADPAPRLHAFAELELEKLVHVDSNGRGGTSAAEFVTERLYGDIVAFDALQVRLGKFLTPVGRWNVIHAQPLVWTTSRPLVTFVPFDPHTTGAMIHGSLFSTRGTVSYSVYGQFVNQLDPATQPATERSAGTRLEVAPRRGPAVGLSYLASHRESEWQHLGGLDTLWRWRRLELMGELVYADSPGSPASQWGLYVQSALQVTRRLHLVQRFEHFDPRGSQPEVNLVVLGLAFKPAPYLVLKAEYLIADHVAEESPPGFKSSVAILF